MTYENKRTFPNEVYIDFYEWLERRSTNPANSGWAALFDLHNSGCDINELRKARDLFEREDNVDAIIDKRIIAARNKRDEAQMTLVLSFLDYLSKDVVETSLDLFRARQLNC